MLDPCAKEVVSSTESSSQSQQLSLFGLPVSALTKREAVILASEAVNARRSLLFGVINAAKVVRMRDDPALFRAVVAADLILADGMSVVFASKILGKPLPERVTGIDLMYDLLEKAAGHGWRVYLLGATQEVLDSAKVEILRRYPGIQIAGSHHGYFSEKEESKIVNEIKKSEADLLFVGMGSPKKERFLAKWADETGAPVCHGVGGSFDVMAGLVGRAPEAVQAMGLEWLWRVGQEPRRLWRRYLVTNTAFSLMLAEALLAKLIPKGFRHTEDPSWMPWPRIDTEERVGMEEPMKANESSGASSRSSS